MLCNTKYQKLKLLDTLFNVLQINKESKYAVSFKSQNDILSSMYYTGVSKKKEESIAHLFIGGF
jgi:hypothetical protein